MWLSCLVACLYVSVTLAANEYLPPSNGYTYNTPKIPFPPTTAPGRVSESLLLRATHKLRHTNFTIFVPLHRHCHIYEKKT